MSFFTFLTDSKSASNSAFFDTQIAFWEEAFFIILAPFANFEGKRGQNG
jgi:hypothetical protein